MEYNYWAFYHQGRHVANINKTAKEIIIPPSSGKIKTTSKTFTP